MDIQSQISTEIGNHIQRVKRGIGDRMDMLGRNASGRSVRSLAVEVNADRGALTGDAQWAVMQKGRGGGSVPKGFREIIRQWILDKGISVSPKVGINSMAFLISRSIAQKGTLLYRKGRKDDIVDSAISKEWFSLQERAMLIVGESVDKVNDIYIKEE